MNKRFTLFLSAALLSLIFVSGCASTAHFKDAENFYNQGNYQKAAACFPTDDARPTSEGVQTNLYLGSIHFMNQDYKLSNEYFNKAEEGMKIQDGKLNWGTAYMARTYDSVMSNTYQAWNLLFQNQPDNARVWLNRLEQTMGKATQRSQRAIDRRQEEIEKKRKDNADQSKSVDATIAKFNNDPKYQKYMRDLDTWGAYGDFENPASRLLCGIFRLYFATDASDLEKAVYHLRRTNAMVQNANAQLLLDIAEKRANGKTSLNDLVIVIYENGLGPTKVEQRFDLIIPLKKPIHAGIALPKLVRRDKAYPFLVIGDGTSNITQTQPFCDFDRIVATEFKQELPGIIAREITEMVIKVALQVAATEIAEQQLGSWGGLAVGIAGSVLSYATTHADVRNWNLLPKEYQICVMKRPASGKITLTPEKSNMIPATITLPQKGPVLIYAKTAVVGRPMITALIKGE